MYPRLYLSCLVVLLGVGGELYAMPAFAKQTGLECMMCHANNQTNLNSFGRNFANSGYTMSAQSYYSKSFIEGKDIGLNLETVLNPSVMLKARYDKGEDVSNGKGVVLQTKDEEPIESNRGLYEIFKTSTINIAGKVSDNVGSIIELREKEDKAIFGGKVVSSFETGDSYSGLAIYSTDNYGPFTGMESFSTGLYKPLRQFENHKLTNAAQAADLGSGAATGLQIFYAGENLFLTVGAYVPIQNSDGIDIGSSMIPFARLAYEQPIGNMRIIVGTYGMSGKAKASNILFDSTLEGYVPRELVELKKEAYGFDLQLEGELLSKEFLLTINSVLKNEITLDKPYLMNYIAPTVRESIYGDPSDADMRAYSIALEVYPIDALGLKVAYLRLDDDGPHTYELDKVDAKDKDAYTFGFDYSLTQNIKFTMEYSMVQAQRENVEDFTDLLAVLTISF